MLVNFVKQALLGTKTRHLRLDIRKLKACVVFVPTDCRCGRSCAMKSSQMQQRHSLCANRFENIRGLNKPQSHSPYSPRLVELLNDAERPNRWVSTYILMPSDGTV
jgi:hypothetical protein